MTATFFSTAVLFRKWLIKNHQKQQELLVGFYKVATGKPSMSWSESVDEALCFGWIDGVRKSIDAESYSIRFTPRKPASIWSAINIKKVEVLTQAGLMTPEGIKAFEYKTANRTKVYSHENEAKQLGPGFEKLFKKNKIAWAFFSTQVPSYKKVMVHWIMSAKKEATRLSRLQKTIAISAEQKRMQ